MFIDWQTTVTSQKERVHYGIAWESIHNSRNCTIMLTCCPRSNHFEIQKKLSSQNQSLTYQRRIKPSDQAQQRIESPQGHRKIRHRHPWGVLVGTVVLHLYFKTQICVIETQICLLQPPRSRDHRKIRHPLGVLVGSVVHLYFKTQICIFRFVFQ